MKVTKPDEQVNDVHRAYMTHNCSFKAVNKADGSLFGVFLNKPLHCNDPVIYTWKNFTDPAYRVTYAAAQELTARFPLFERYPECDRALKAGILSVDTAYRGLGIANALLAKTLQYARDSGYPLVMCIGLNVFSEKMCVRAEFEEIGRIVLAEWEFEGQRPLQVDNDAILYAKLV